MEFEMIYFLLINKTHKKLYHKHLINQEIKRRTSLKNSHRKKVTFLWQNRCSWCKNCVIGPKPPLLAQNRPSLCVDTHTHARERTHTHARIHLI